MSRSRLAEPPELSPYDHHLQEFLTFLKRERGFAEATIINRKRSLKPFLAWLVAQGVPLSSVSPVVMTKYFTSAVAGRWKRTTVSFHVQSLRSFFRYASSRGWCAAGIAESIDAPRVYTYENLPQGPASNCRRDDFCVGEGAAEWGEAGRSEDWRGGRFSFSVSLDSCRTELSEQSFDSHTLP